MASKKCHVDRPLGGGLLAHLVSPPGQDQWFVSSFTVDQFQGPQGMPHRLDTLTAHRNRVIRGGRSRLKMPRASSWSGWLAAAELPQRWRGLRHT
jgi:hypothetical protein